MRYIKQKDIIIILIIYLIIQIIFQINNVTLLTEIIKPIFWLIFLGYLIYKNYKFYHRLPNNKSYTIKMLIVTTIYFIIYFYLGFILGFTESPYNHSINGILKNSFQMIIPLIGIEISRSLVVNSNKENFKIIILITTILFIIELNFNMIIPILSQPEIFFKYIAHTIIPLFCNSLLFTFLTLKGSYQLPLIYRIMDRLIVIILPVYPSTNWFAISALGIIVPVTYYLLFKYVFTNRQHNNRKRKKINKISLITAILISITLVSFMLGLFKYEPVAILSNSMLPRYSRGDIVIYEKMDKSRLQNITKNSIIIYRIGNQTVAHRVVNVIQENEKILYETKGDNNNTVDSALVSTEQILGVYRCHFKYIGYPSVWLNEFFIKEKAKVETK